MGPGHPVIIWPRSYVIMIMLAVVMMMVMILWLVVLMMVMIL